MTRHLVGSPRPGRAVTVAAMVWTLGTVGTVPLSAQQGEPAQIHEAPPVAADLPANNDVNDGTDNTDVGLLQIELGSQWTRIDADTRAAALPFVARYGAFEWLELTVGTDLVSGQVASGVGVHGIGDLQVGGRLRLFASRGGLPPLSIYPQVNLPTADGASGLGTSHVDPSLGLLTGRDLPHGGHVDAAYSAGWVGEGEGLGRFGQQSASLSASLGVTAAWTPALTLQWVSQQDVDAGAAMLLSADSVVTVSRRVALDVSLQLGLTPAAPRIGLGGGASFVLGELDLDDGVHARRHRLRVWPHRRRAPRPRR